MNTVQQTELKDRQRDLKAMLRKSKYKVYCNLRRVSRSGMSRVISFHIAVNGDITDITWWINKCLVDSKGKPWYSIDKSDYGLRVEGCGMDMGFAVVYDLSCELYGRKCKEGQNETPKSGPYKLKHVWM